MIINNIQGKNLKRSHICIFLSLIFFILISIFIDKWKRIFRDDIGVDAIETCTLNIMTDAKESCTLVCYNNHREVVVVVVVGGGDDGAVMAWLAARQLMALPSVKMHFHLFKVSVSLVCRHVLIVGVIVVYRYDYMLLGNMDRGIVVRYASDNDASDLLLLYHMTDNATLFRDRDSV